MDNHDKECEHSLEFKKFVKAFVKGPRPEPAKEKVIICPNDGSPHTMHDCIAENCNLCWKH